MIAVDNTVLGHQQLQQQQQQTPQQALPMEASTAPPLQLHDADLDFVHRLLQEAAGSIADVEALKMQAMTVRALHGGAGIQQARSAPAPGAQLAPLVAAPPAAHPVPAAWKCLHPRTQEYAMSMLRTLSSGRCV